MDLEGLVRQLRARMNLRDQAEFQVGDESNSYQGRDGKKGMNSKDMLEKINKLWLLVKYRNGGKQREKPKDNKEHFQ